MCPLLCVGPRRATTEFLLRYAVLSSFRPSVDRSSGRSGWSGAKVRQRILQAFRRGSGSPDNAHRLIPTHRFLDCCDMGMGWSLALASTRTRVLA
jgi:hypothetical protein